MTRTRNRMGEGKAAGKSTGGIGIRPPKIWASSPVGREIALDDDDEMGVEGGWWMGLGADRRARHGDPTSRCCCGVSDLFCHRRMCVRGRRKLHNSLHTHRAPALLPSASASSTPGVPPWYTNQPTAGMAARRPVVRSQSSLFLDPLAHPPVLTRSPGGEPRGPALWAHREAVLG